MDFLYQRPNRPAPSRKSAFEADIPKVIYSQPPTDFKPAADYIGPGKSYMERPPDRSMNPPAYDTIGLPVLSVSKLHVPKPTPKKSNGKSKSVTFPAVGKPRIKSTLVQNSQKHFEAHQTKNILKKMPQVFQKQFKSELNLKKRRVHKTNLRHFMHYDFHETKQQEAAVLHGILLLGGDHRDIFEAAPEEPGTPPPLSGRQHCIMQTDTWLEDIADYETEFKNTEMQCEDIYDEPLEASNLNFETGALVTTGTQLEECIFPNVAHAFDQVVVNLTEAIILESLKQLQEEYELDALRKQFEFHNCVRNHEIALLSKYRSAESKHQEQKKYLENGKTWEEELEANIDEVGFDKIRDLAPKHFVQGRIDRAIYDQVKETIVPPINSSIVHKVEKVNESRDLLDAIIEETVLIREAEYAGRMYPAGLLKKGSLATDTFSEEGDGYSVGEMNEWSGEVEYDEDTLVGEDETPYYPMILSTSPRGKESEEEGEDADPKRPRKLSASSGGSMASEEYEENEDFDPKSTDVEEGDT